MFLIAHPCLVPSLMQVCVTGVPVTMTQGDLEEEFISYGVKYRIHSAEHEGATEIATVAASSGKSDSPDATFLSPSVVLWKCELCSEYFKVTASQLHNPNHPIAPGRTHKGMYANLVIAKHQSSEFHTRAVQWDQHRKEEQENGKGQSQPKIEDHLTPEQEL